MTAHAHKTRSLLILLVGLLLVGGGVLLVGPRLFSGSDPAPPEDAARAPVKWMEARQFFVEEWTEAIGTTQPLPDCAAHITAPVEGQVVAVLVGSKGKPAVEGQLVKKGDIIVQLDADLAKAHHAKALAALDELAPLTKQAEHAVKMASMDFTRLTDLGASGAAENKTPLVSRFEMQKAQVALDDAKAKLKAVELHEITAKKELRILEEELKRLTLAAPIDGRLGRLFVSQGQTLTPGTHVADVVNVDERIDVICFVPPHVARRLKVGQPARVGGVDDPQQASAAAAIGKVEFIADHAEVDTGNIAIKIRFPNNEMGLRANTTLRVRILTNPGKACLTLPDAALFEDEDPPTVIVVENYKQEKNKEDKEIETGKARKLQVKLGIRDRVLHLVEIVSLHDPENQWQGRLEEAKFVIERGRGLRNGDLIQLQVEED